MVHPFRYLTAEWRTGGFPLDMIESCQPVRNSWHYGWGIGLTAAGLAIQRIGTGDDRTNEERMILLGFFCRSFMKPQQDQYRLADPDVVERATPTLKW